jgi:predicted alpha/beta superfamily hydrolase
MKKIILFYTLFYLLTNIVSIAQQSCSENLKSETIIINSKVLNEDRKIYVYKPVSYASYWFSTSFDLSSEPLPVLYLMDGDIHSSIIASQINYLSNMHNVLPPMLVVGIDNYHYDRWRDLTPTHNNDFNIETDTSIISVANATGGGEKFLQFIKTELFPYIEQHYKTAQFKIFSGHSLGGLMSFYCLSTYPDMFDAYIAVSPSLWWDNFSVLHEAFKRSYTDILKNKYFFFCEEGDSSHSSILQLDSLLKQKNISGLKYKYVFYPDETHGSVPIKAVYDGLHFIYPKWEPAKTDTTVEMINNYYAQLSIKYGYTILPPEFIIYILGYRALRDPHKIDYAIKLFELNIENYPNSYNSYDCLGDAYAIKGEKSKAIANYKKAIKLNLKNETTRRKLKALQEFE